MGWPPRASIEHTDRVLVFMGLVSRSSCVTTRLKPLSPTPRLSRGRKNELIQGEGRVSLSLVAKTSFRCRAYFDLVGTSERLPYADHVKYMVWDHTQIET
jgi:hypothetical protein